MVYLDRSRDQWEEQHLKPTTKVNTRLKLAFIVQWTKVTLYNNFSNIHIYLRV